MGREKSLRGCAGAHIVSAAPTVFLAIFLAAVALLFAIRAEASFAESNTPPAAGGGTQSAQGVASTAEADSSPSVLRTVTSAAAAGSGEAGSGGTAAVEPQKPRPGSQTSGTTGGASSTQQALAPGSSGPASAPSGQASAPGPVATSEQSTTAATGVAAMTEQSTSSSSVVAGAGAIMLERASHAEVITSSRPALVPGYPPETAALADLQGFVVQFELLMRASRALSAEVLASEATRAAAQELQLVSVISSPSNLSPGVPGPLPRAGDWSDVPSAIGSAERSSEASSSNRSERLGAVSHTSSAPELAAPATGAGLLPSLAGAACGGGAPGLAVPAAALLEVAAACLLVTRSLGRLPMDSLAWKSTLLSVRLERPG